MANALKKIRKINVCLLFLFLSCLLEIVGHSRSLRPFFHVFLDLPSASLKEGGLHVRCCCLILSPLLCRAYRARLIACNVAILWGGGVDFWIGLVWFDFFFFETESV